MSCFTLYQCGRISLDYSNAFCRMFSHDIFLCQDLYRFIAICLRSKIQRRTCALGCRVQSPYLKVVYHMLPRSCATCDAAVRRKQLVNTLGKKVVTSQIFNFLFMMYAVRSIVFYQNKQPQWYARPLNLISLTLLRVKRTHMQIPWWINQ